MNWKRELKRGITDGQVVPHFQPIVDLRSGTTTSFEILARWNHPIYGTVSPAEFIPTAERSGLMDALTESLLRSALRTCRGLPQDIKLSLNISPTQLSGQCLANMLEVVAEEAAFPLARLTLEITESALLQNYEEAERTLSSLKEMGCRLALDDFGTGYSSLTYLRSLPLDVLKIDQSFVRMMVTRREDRKIVGAVVGLGKSLGLRTVAEGIEEQAQAEMLLYLGCDCGQGWLYGRPSSGVDISLAAAVRPMAASPRNNQTDTILCVEALPAQSYAQLIAIYNSAPVGLCFFDCSFRFVTLNHRLAAFHHLAIEELVGQAIRDVDPVRYVMIEPYLIRARSGETIEHVEFLQSPTSRGEEVTHMASFQPALDEVGEVVGVLVSVTDITERKQAELKVLESRAYLQKVLDAMPTGVVIAEAPSGKIVSRNPYVQQILAQDPLSFRAIDDYSKRVAYYQNGVRLRSADFPLARALNNGETSKPERVFYDMGKGTGKWLNVSSAPIIDEQGCIIGAVATLQEAWPFRSSWGMRFDRLFSFLGRLLNRLQQEKAGSSGSAADVLFSAETISTVNPGS